MQAPKENDLDAQALMNRMEEVISVLDDAAQEAEGMGGHPEVSLVHLNEVQRLCEYVKEDKFVGA